MTQLRSRLAPVWLLLVVVGSSVGVGCIDPDLPGNLVPRTVVEDASLPAIELADTRLHAEAFGDPEDPMLLVLHGGPGGDYRGLLPLAELAEDGYYVVFWDQRGAGLSQRHRADHIEPSSYVDDIPRVIEHFSHDEEQPVVFIGHSWGAMYAAWFLHEYGDYGGRIRGAIFSEPGGFDSDEVASYFRRLFGSFEFFGEMVNDAAWTGQFVSPKEHARADYVAVSRAPAGAPAEHLDPEDPAPKWRWGAVVEAKLLAYAADPGFDWTPHLGEFSSKVLFLRGELNEAMPLAHQQRLAALFASSDVVTIDGVGHELVWQAPDAYLTEARTYLAGLDLEVAAR